MRGARHSAAGALALAGVLVCAVPAVVRADFSAATLLSGTAQIQFDHANGPALSSDGRYVAFQGSRGGVSGVWRRDLRSGALEPEPVAVSEPEKPTSAPDAAAPSISADGRYVAFTTTADLQPERVQAGTGTVEGEPAPDKGCPEVYVRDMDRTPGEEGAYVLASELNGSDAGIAFAGSCAQEREGFAIAGAQAAPAVALSADGRRVAFTVLSPSDLSGPCSAATPVSCPTPPSQVAVRDLDTHATTLVSVTPEGQATPGGGAYPSAESEQSIFVSTARSGSFGDELTGSSAAISADGSTVAWLGTDVPAQVPESKSEIEAHMSGHPGGEAEPLWRRIADGPGAVTRRLLVGAGLDLFYSYFGDSTGAPVWAGSFGDARDELLFVPPVLSADGHTVALTADAPRPAAVASALFTGQSRPTTTDAYVVRVGGETASPPQVTPLTETPDYDTTPGALGFIRDIAISPDGDRVAFEAQRDQFTLPSLALVSPPATSTAFQVYEANLALGTLQRATVTYDGSEPAGDGGLLAFSSDGHALAFASEAENLFYGDALKAPEVYIAAELPSEAPPAAQQLAPVPFQALPIPEWRLDATAVAQSDGSVVLYVQAPGAGELRVNARAQLPALPKAAVRIRGAGRRSRPGRLPRASPSRRDGKGRRSAGGAGRAAPRLFTLTVARGRMSARAPGELRLRLRATRPYAGLVRRDHGLYALLEVTFAAPGRPALAQEIPVTFHLGVRRHGAREHKPARRLLATRRAGAPGSGAPG
jgi:Tol biopolymer transport system component